MYFWSKVYFEPGRFDRYGHDELATPDYPKPNGMDIFKNYLPHVNDWFSLTFLHNSLYGMKNKVDTDLDVYPTNSVSSSIDPCISTFFLFKAMTANFRYRITLSVLYAYIISFVPF